MVTTREITDAQALDDIAADLDMSEWDADLISGIADRIRMTGRAVRDLTGDDDERDSCTCCETRTLAGRVPDDECPACGHLWSHHHGAR